MTTNWTPSGDEWAGATVAVLGNGASLEADLAKLPTGCKLIAANRAGARAPHVDVILAIDGNPPPEGFQGQFVVGVPSEAAGLYLGMPYERVDLAPGNVLEIRNNALQAVRLAARMGARAILLAGFDTDAYEQLHNFPGVTLALEQLMGELRGRGVAVDFVE